MIVWIFEGTAILLLALAVITQIVIPALHGRPFFPIFRRERALQHELEEARQAAHERELEQAIEKEKSGSNNRES